MKLIQTKIGTHIVQLNLNSQTFINFIQRSYLSIKDQHNPDLYITIIEGYGKPFVDYHVDITKTNEKITYRRADYLIEVDTSYRFAVIYAHDNLALKHAMTNLYSAFIVHNEWGLLIHSSCVIEKGNAHVFAGRSGAGKSTAARLSEPRPLLSDEATLIQITPKKAIVFHSPFRSEITSIANDESVKLASIQLLQQSPKNNRIQLRKSDALMELMDKVFYWTYDPEETKMIFRLLNTLVNNVPAYKLYFKKDPTFWELIS